MTIGPAGTQHRFSYLKLGACKWQVGFAYFYIFPEGCPTPYDFHQSFAFERYLVVGLSIKTDLVAKTSAMIHIECGVQGAETSNNLPFVFLNHPKVTDARKCKTTKINILFELFIVRWNILAKQLHKPWSLF